MEPKPCVFCKQPFVPTQSARVYCSKACFYAHREERSTVVSECKNCGEPITYKRGRPIKFCSYSCGAQWRYRGRKKKYTCAQCGKEFFRAVSSVNGKKVFCSTACHGKWKSVNETGPESPYWRQVERVCENCGATFTAHAYRKDTARFCSRLCHNRGIAKYGEEHPNWRGGYAPYYGPNWRRQRRKARKRDNHTCRECGKTREENGQALDVHHIIPFHKFGVERYKEANHLDNLISLCRVCHGRTEWPVNPMNSKR